MIFWRFPKIIQNLSEGHMNIAEHFQKIAEDFQGRPEDVSILQHKLDISEITDIFASGDMENMPPDSCGFLWILQVVYFPVKQSCLCNKCTFVHFVANLYKSTPNN